MLTLEHVSKTYTKDGVSVRAVDDVSLNIREGEIFGIIGFSGAGKSTLVRCMNLLERPDEGGIVIFDGLRLTEQSKAQLRQSRQKIGMIFQHFNLMPSRTVLENVYFPLLSRGLLKSELEDKARDLLKSVGLLERAEAYPSELSGGQKQRVAIARALSSNPRILLLDEATSALDPTTTGEILELLRELNQKLRLTMVIITHEMAVVKDLCHRVAVMEQGHILECGDTFEVFANSSNRTTRKFISVTSRLSRAEELLLKKPNLLNLLEHEKYVRFTFLDKGVSEPLLYTLGRRFNVSINIILADVDFVGDHPLGGTVAVLSGEERSIEAALSWISERKIKVEVLNGTSE